MPLATRLLIKTSFVYLVFSLALGLWLVFQKITGNPIYPLDVVYIHIFMVGWVTQIIFGVAHWFLPKYSNEQPRGNETLIIAAFLLLNTGLILRSIVEPMILQPHSILVSSGLVVASIFQWIAGLLFVINSWPRVKER